MKRAGFPLALVAALMLWLSVGATAQGEAAASPAAAACTTEQDASPELRAQREEVSSVHSRCSKHMCAAECCYKAAPVPPPAPQVVYLWSQAAVSASQFSNNITYQQDFLSTILTQNATLDVKGAGAAPRPVACAPPGAFAAAQGCSACALPSW